MRAPSTYRRGSVGSNLTPMIDVVFLLIIFFLVSSHLARQENRLPLDLPVASTPDPLDLERTALTISVDEQSRWRVGSKIIDRANISGVLLDLLQRDGESAAVRVRTDQSVEYRDVEPILRAAARAGIVDVSLSVLRGPSE